VTCVALLIGVPGVQAQLSTGSINGRITDDTGGALPGVTVTVRNLATNQTRSVPTNESGRYQIQALQPSRYSVTFELQGFATIVRPEVTVNVGSAVDVDVIMKVAGVAETVTVTGEAPLVQSTKTDLSNVITQAAIENLPSRQKNYLDFITLMPATVENVSTVQGTGAVIGGARSKEGTLLVDGFYNLDEAFTMQKQRHSQDTIQEFQLLTFGGAAEYGRAIGGIINAVTKSGGNTFSGTGYGFFRDKNLNALSEDLKLRGSPKAQYDRQQWGGSFGGPIKTDKAFFFMSYEHLNDNWPYDNGIKASDAAAIGLPPADAGTIPRFFNSNFAFGKLDYAFSSGERLQASFGFTKYTDLECCTDALAARSYSRELFPTDYSVVVNWTKVVGSGKWMYELKGSYFPRRYWSNGLQLGGPPLVPDGQINQFPPNGGSPPTVSIASVANFGDTWIQNRINTDPYQAIYTSSVFMNKHTVKFGADYMYAYQNYQQYNPLHGAYTFSSLANYLKSVYSTYTQSFGSSDNSRSHQYFAMFVQDSWRAATGLTVNYGLRYDLEHNPAQKASGIPFGNDYNNLGPRLAFSYDLTGKGKTFLKASSGVYYDRLWGNATSNLYLLKDHQTRISATWRPTDPGAPVYPQVFATQPANLPKSVLDAVIMPTEVNAPKSAQVVVTIEHSISNNLAISADAVYSKSWEKEYNVDTNLAWDATSQKFIRIDPNYRRITQVTYGAPAEYQAFVVDLRRRGVKFGFDGNLTLSRARQTGTSYANDPRIGIMGDDGSVPDTPTIRGVVNGWYNITPTIQVSSNFTARSGMAVNPVATGLDLLGTSVTGTRTPTLAPFSFREPATATVDVRFVWGVPIGPKGRKISVYVESFNLTNRVNVRTVDNNYGPTPGQPLAHWMVPTSYFAPREVQLGARLYF
jgi:hypothetical protein